MKWTEQNLSELIQSIIELERMGKRFLVDYGYENAVEKLKELKRPVRYVSDIANGKHLADYPPPMKKDWNHSEQVLVYYDANPEANISAEWGIAYYHYKPPFGNSPHWVDFRHIDRTPKFWWVLPKL